MQVENLITYNNELLTQIANQCDQFIRESQGLPLLKNLPASYPDVHKVKVRHQQKDQDLDEMFNQAFYQQYSKLRQRAIFACGPSSFEPCNPHYDYYEPFFVFPINNYRFMYSKEVQNSSSDYKQVLDTLYKHLDSAEAFELATDLLKFSYVIQQDLATGIDSGAEIILYNIPYFYVIRMTVVDDYDKLLTALTNLKDSD